MFNIFRKSFNTLVLIFVTFMRTKRIRLKNDFEILFTVIKSFIGYGITQKPGRYHTVTVIGRREKIN